MKILTKKKQDDILMRIAAIEILQDNLEVVNRSDGVTETYSEEYFHYMDRITYNMGYIIRAIAGRKGFKKVRDFVDEFTKKEK